MPLVRISLKQKNDEQVRAISEAVHSAMVETVGIPADDKFQVITEHEGTRLIYDRSYLGIDRSDDAIFVQITLNGGRTTQQKRDLYARIAEKLSLLGIRPQDVLVNLVEVAAENWSFGNGEAQYAS